MNVFQDFTYDKTHFGDLPALVKNTSEHDNLKWVFIIDAAIHGNDSNYRQFKEGYEHNIYVTWDKSVPVAERANPPNAPTERSVFYGRVWPRGPSAYPDFFKKITGVWWAKNLQEFHHQISYDGIWIVSG